MSINRQGNESRLGRPPPDGSSARNLRNPIREGNRVGLRHGEHSDLLSVLYLPVHVRKIFLFMSGTVVLGLMSSDLDLVTSASAIASSLDNIGPGLGAVGPTSNFMVIPDAGRWLLSFLMIAGRLEIFPLVLLFTRNLWRR
ncbi:MAG: potassium transporter TrkG [Acidimicrobiia bacterium]